MKKTTSNTFYKLKKNREKFAALTAYDVTSAQLCKEAKIPLVLVGDSASMVVFGFDSTLPINMEEMVMLTRAVKRSNDYSFIVSYCQIHKDEIMLLHPKIIHVDSSNSPIFLDK